MDIVVCKCGTCDATLGSLANLWTQIGKKYMTPEAHVDDEPLRISTSGVVRLGEADTLVGGCQLQDADCVKCGAKLGQKCLSVPENHALQDGQVIFRAAAITLRLASDQRRKPEPKIKRALNLKSVAATGGHGNSPPAQEAPPNLADMPGDSAVDSLDLLQFQADLDAQRQHINRIGSTGMQLMTDFEAAIARVERQMQQLRESVDSVRRDGHGHADDLKSLRSEVADVRWDCQNSGVVSRLDQQLQTTDRVVTELRQALGRSKSEADHLRKQLTATQQELQEARNETARLGNQVDEAKQMADESMAVSKEHASQLSALRRQIKQLRAELAERPQAQAPEPSSYSAHELDILASSISKIGNRASQVETLQMEFELFRTRLQRIEARISTSGATPGRGCATMGAGAAGLEDDNAEPGREQNMRRKRASTGRDDDAQNSATTPLKRVARSPSDFDSGVSAGYTRVGSLFPSSPGAKVAEPWGPRRTRADATNRRVARPDSWETRG